MIKLPPLPYEKNALEPYISENTLSFHYDKHHQGYCNKLNELIVDTEYQEKSVIDIIKSADGPIFNNAAQIWNHSFYWLSMSDKHHQSPCEKTKKALEKSFGSYEKFIEEFSKQALSLFGSGYTWLVYNPSKNLLEIINTPNAKTPITEDLVPLMTCDIWEHAYYLDTQNLRPKYIENFLNVLNWQFVSDNLRNCDYSDE